MLDELFENDRPGRQDAWVDVTTLSTGSEVRIPVILLRGANEGPTLYVGAVMHGTELNGIGVMMKLLDSLDEGKLAGSLLMVPVQNPIAFQHKTHELPTEIYHVSSANVYTAFPGSPSGDISDRIAHALFQLVLSSDFAIDLHTGGTSSNYLDQTFCFFSGGPHGDTARDLAKVFGTPIVVDKESGIWVRDNMFHEAARSRGVPAFGAELGTGGCLESGSVEAGYQGIMNVLRHLGMLPGSPKPNPNQVVIDTILPLTASRGGIVEHCVELGARVAKGQPVTRIHSLHLRPIEELLAPEDGIVYVQSRYPTVNGGEEEVVVVGVPKE